MRRAVRSFLSLFVAAAFLTGCQNAGEREKAGAVLGAVAGVVVAVALMNGDAGKAAAAVVGGTIGAIAGGMIGKVLDENDKRLADAAASRAAAVPNDQMVEWASDRNAGVYGYAKPVTSPQPVNGLMCRQVKSFHWVNGKEEIESNRFCFVDGKWAAA